MVYDLICGYYEINEDDGKEIRGIMWMKFVMLLGCIFVEKMVEVFILVNVIVGFDYKSNLELEVVF